MARLLDLMDRMPSLLWASTIVGGTLMLVAMVGIMIGLVASCR